MNNKLPQIKCFLCREGFNMGETIKIVKIDEKGEMMHKGCLDKVEHFISSLGYEVDQLDN